MAAVTTHLFSSPYAFNPVGVTEFLDRFKHGLDDPEHAPFVSYDTKDNLFSLTIDRQDAATATYFLAQLKYFTNQHVSNPIVMEPRIHQLNEIVARRTFDQDSGHNPGLLDIYDEDGKSDSGEEVALQSMKHLTAYWYPQEGDIKILTTAIAENVASLTGCSIYPEAHENRVRLVHGDFTSALRKLQNMEPLLALQHQQRSFNSARANANVLLPTADDPNPSMRFWPVADPFHPAFKRVIVDGRAAPYLEQKFICESFNTVLEDNGIDEYRTVPPNMASQGISKTTRIGPSAVWNGHIYKSMGEETNKEPRALSDLISKQRSELSSTPSRVGINQHIEPTKAAQVAAWSGQVDDMVDPNLSQPEPPTEPTTARRRLVAVESDSEDDENDDRPAQDATAVASTEHPSAHDIKEPVHVAKRKKTNDLISLSSAAPPISANIAGVSRQDGTGTSIFRAGAPERDLLDASTVASNLLDRDSQAAPSPFLPSQDARPCQETGGRHTNTPFNALGSDSGGDSDHKTDHWQQVSHKPKPDHSAASLPRLPESERGELQNPAQLSSAGDWEVVQPSEPRVKPNKIRTYDGTFSDNNTTTSSQSPSASTKPSSMPPADNNGLPKGFDPTAYGLRSRGLQNSRPSSRGTTNSTSPPMPCIASSSPRGRQNGALPSRGRGTIFRGRGGRPQNEEERLIDLEINTTQSKLLIPPPGLEIHIPNLPAFVEDKTPSQSPELPNLMDGPLEVPSGRSSSAVRDRSDLISFSNGPRSHVSRGPPSFVSQADYDQWSNSREYENHVPYRTNIRTQKEATIQKLMAIQDSSATTTAKKANNAQPRFHSTMSQKAGNPGKKNKGAKGKTESAEQARRRKQKALEDAYGNPVSTIPPSQPRPRTENLSQMSKAEQKLLKTNVNMALSNSEALQHTARSQATEQIINALSPVFEAARALNGMLRFEIQLGQVMVTSNGLITTDKAVTVRSWDKVMGSYAKGNGPLTSFTNILTSNGADIDRVLETKAASGAFKLWDKSSPGPVKVTYEFHCQSKQGIDLWLVVDGDGNYEIRNLTTTIGMVAIHCPMQVWDAAALLQGEETWKDPPTAISEAVAEFVDSIYTLPERHKLVLIFRQPKTLEIIVRNVVLKRLSLHQCRLMDHHDILLQVTESKVLSTKIHPADKRLWQAFEKDYDSMIREGSVCYGMSIIDKGVNEILVRNKDLEVGELTSAISTGTVLLRKESIVMMLDLAAHMLSKVDWMGADNYGTLLRKVVSEQEQQMRQQQSLPPTARSRMHQPVLPASKAPSRYGGSMIGSGAVGGNDTFVGMTRIPGTRANTMAEVYEDAEGKFYAKGMGGAHVPITNPSMLGRLGTIGEEVGPDDSASQYGMAKSRAVTSRRPADDKGASFW